MLEKILHDITKFSALDWEEHLSAVFWFGGCNMRCPYCHNADVVFGKPNISKDEAFRFLKSRLGRLEAVVLSGGECTLYKELPSLAKEIKELGYKVKIDTNGTNPKMIKQMVDEGLVDFISLDYKAPKEKYIKITAHKDFKKFSQTLDFLIQSGADFEVRTTVHTDLLDEEDINTIIKDLHKRGFNKRYFIQNYYHQDKTLKNMQKQKRVLDTSKIDKTLIDIAFRNFK